MESKGRAPGSGVCYSHSCHTGRKHCGTHLNTSLGGSVRNQLKPPPKAEKEVALDCRPAVITTLGKFKQYLGLASYFWSVKQISTSQDWYTWIHKTLRSHNMYKLAT